MFNDLGTTLRNAFQDSLSALFSFLPSLIGALVLVLIGWFVGRIIGSIVTRVLRSVRFNEIAEKAEVDGFLRNAGVRADPATVIGGIVRWFVYFVFFIAAFNALGLTQVSAIIDDFLLFLPKLIVALVILLGGALVAKLLASLVRGSAASAGVVNSDLYATIARYGVIAFAVIAALDVLNIAPTVVDGLYLALLAVVVGTFVLAFGLGGREAARALTVGGLLRSELGQGTEIHSQNFRGKVQAVGSLYTTLETQSGIVKVPNAELLGQTIEMSQADYQRQIEQRQQRKDQAKQALASSAETAEARRRYEDRAA